MAVRKKLNHDDKTRQKIQTSQLINRLEKHIFGDLEIEATQLRAIEILLKKTLPDLQATEISGSLDTGQAAISEKPMTAEKWEEQYAADMGTPGGATASTH